MSRSATAIPFVVALTLATAATAAAAEAPLTLEQALTLARERNLDLKAAEARLQQAATFVTEARAALLPQATAQGEYTHNYKQVTFDIPPLGGAPAQTVIILKEDALNGIAAVSVPLLVPAAYPGFSAARTSYAAQQASTQATEASLLLNVAQAFYAAAGTDELLVARRNAVTVAQQSLDNARVRVEAGTATRVDVTRAEVALVRAQQAVLEAGDARERAYLALATLIQRKPPFRVVPPPEPPQVSVPVPELVQGAFTLRPEVLALERSASAARKQAHAAAWRWAPALSGFGNVMGANYAGFSGDKYSWAVGLQLNWLIYDGGVRDAERHRAWAQRRELLDRLALLKDDISNEVVNAARAVAVRQAALAAARRARELSEETLNLTREQYAAGRAIQLDVLQAQDSLVVAEVEVARARFALGVAAVQLKWAAGLFPGT